MSRLPKAPLIEVVFELKWNISKGNLMKIPYFYGDIYAELKDKYAYRENVIPSEIPLEFTINQPVHRYRTAKDEYPLIQVGPGLVALNTIDSKYFWAQFSTWANELNNSFFGLYNFDSEEKISPSILFIDFFPFDFEQSNVHQFINNNFNIGISQNFYKTEKYSKDINISFSYETEIGDLSVLFQKGFNSNKESGIILQTKLIGNTLEPDRDNITRWIETAHNICSESFKKLTEGNLYNSFSN